MNDLHADSQFFLEKYDFLEKIGSGGMGVVYKVRHKILGRLFAVKMLHAHALTTEAIQRFQSEGKAASALAHPNVIRIHDFGTTDGGQPYMVMEYIEGSTLSDVLASEGQIELNRFLPIFDQVCQGLAHAHSHAIVHRDIKPSNIMLTRNVDGFEEVKIMDFGVAKMLLDPDSANLTSTGETVGSPIYMSPEQTRGISLDQRADLYSLGCVMYEALAGTPPFSGKSVLETMRMHLQQNPISLKAASLGKEFDLRMEILIRKLLEKNPDDRFASADELRRALLEIQDLPAKNGAPAETTWATKKESIQHSAKLPVSPKMMRPLLLATAAIIVLVGASAVVFFTQTPSIKQKDGKQKDAIVSAETESSPVATASSSTAPPAQPVSTTATKADDTFDDFSAGVGIPSRTGGEKDSTKSVQSLVQRIVDDHDSDVDLNRSGIRLSLTDNDLAPVEGATFVREVTLKSCVQITDKGLKYLRKLPLTKLVLSQTQVQSLADLKGMTSLTSLAVDHTPIRPSGFAALQNLHNLESLTLDNTDFNDEDAKLLYGLKGLLTLSLRNCKLSDEAVSTIKSHLPNCKILYYRTASAGASRKTVQSLFKETDELCAIGRWKEALERTKEAQKMIDSLDRDKAETIINSLDHDKAPATPNEAASLRREGYCLLHLHRYRDAIIKYEQSLQALPLSNSDPLLASVLSHEAQAHEAAAEYDSAIELRIKANSVYEANSKNVSAHQENLVEWSENMILLANDYALRNQQSQVKDALASVKQLLSKLPAEKLSVAEKMLKDQLNSQHSPDVRKAELEAIVHVLNSENKSAESTSYQRMIESLK